MLDSLSDKWIFMYRSSRQEISDLSEYRSEKCNLQRTKFFLERPSLWDKKNFQNLIKELRRAYYTSNQGIGWCDNADEDGEDDVGDAGEDVGVEVVGEEELVVGGVTTFAAASSVAPKPHNQKPTSVFSYMPIFFKI